MLVYQRVRASHDGLMSLRMCSCGMIIVYVQRNVASYGTKRKQVEKAVRTLEEKNRVLGQVNYGIVLGGRRKSQNAELKKNQKALRRPGIDLIELAGFSFLEVMRSYTRGPSTMHDWQRWILPLNHQRPIRTSASAVDVFNTIKPATQFYNVDEMFLSYYITKL